MKPWAVFDTQAAQMGRSGILFGVAGVAGAGRTPFVGQSVVMIEVGKWERTVRFVEKAVVGRSSGMARFVGGKPDVMEPLVGR